MPGEFSESEIADPGHAAQAPSPEAPYPPHGGYDPRFDQRGHHGHGYGHGHRKRKKSWLEEIFD